MIYIFDTYAWIEYFLGSEKGKVVQSLLANTKNRIVTLECSIGELKTWSLKNKLDFTVYYRVVRADSWLMKLVLPDWIKAAEIRHEQRKYHKDFGMLDALLLVKQKELRAMVVSGDPHFEGLKEV